jgi:putative RNA 2'-phosphotransferase
MTTDTRSKYLSFLLRHRPEAANLALDKEGWCSIQQLVQNTDFTIAELVQIVREDKKTRYSFEPALGVCLQSGEQPTSIRANQGHSTGDVKLSFKAVTPPVKLYHGADNTVLKKILKDGLLPMSRHHVHLSGDIETAESVGGRRRHGFVVLEIDAKAALADGLKFFISENGVYLAEHVPSKYLRELS